MFLWDTLFFPGGFKGKPKGTPFFWRVTKKVTYLCQNLFNEIQAKGTMTLDIQTPWKCARALLTLPAEYRLKGRQLIFAVTNPCMLLTHTHRHTHTHTDTDLDSAVRLAAEPRPIFAELHGCVGQLGRSAQSPVYGTLPPSCRVRGDDSGLTISSFWGDTVMFCSFLFSFVCVCVFLLLCCFFSF